MRKLIVGCLVALLLICPAFAEMVVLKNGKTVEGKILEDTDTYVKIDFNGTPLTYFKDEVMAIRKDVVDTTGTQAEPDKKSAKVEVLNSEYTKPPDPKENIEIRADSSIEEILKKINYYYASHDFDKAIELGKMALSKTDDKFTMAQIYYSLGANYLEKGIEPYNQNKDDSYYKLSIEYTKKCLEIIPNSWRSWANLGSVYTNMGDYEQAISYLLEAEKYLDKNDPMYKELLFHRMMLEDMLKGK